MSKTEKQVVVRSLSWRTERLAFVDAVVRLVGGSRSRFVEDAAVAEASKALNLLIKQNADG